jgi:hypothetical protein
VCRRDGGVKKRINANVFMREENSVDCSEEKDANLRQKINFERVNQPMELNPKSNRRGKVR